MNRDEFIKLLGPLPLKSALNFRVIEEVDCTTYVRKKISFSSEANENINAYLCIPKKDGPLPAIYCFHQHGANHLLGKSEVVGLAGSSDQAYAKELAERGFVTLAPDAICFEERANADIPYQHHAEQLAALLIQGKTLLGKILFDISAGIDLLESLDFVDNDNIGFIGHSYGGRSALFASPYDRRIKASVCSCGSTTFKEMLRNKIGIQFDFVVPNFINYGDIEDIVQLHEPSSLLIIGADSDKWSLSMDDIHNASHATFKKGAFKVKKFSGKHQFSDDMRITSYEFLEKFLKSDKAL